MRLYWPLKKAMPQSSINGTEAVKILQHSCVESWLIRPPTCRQKSTNKDYYGLDCIFYSERDVMHFPANQYIYVKFITVAIELENDIHSTAIEMNKLQLFNSPLKVLATYPKASEKQAYLDRYSTIMQEADILQDFSTHRKQLVIFGTTNKVTASWTFHVYEDGKFKSI